MRRKRPGRREFLLTAEEVLTNLSGDDSHHVLRGKVALRMRREQDEGHNRERPRQPKHELVCDETPSPVEENVTVLLTRSPRSPFGPMAP